MGCANSTAIAQETGQEQKEEHPPQPPLQKAGIGPSTSSVDSDPSDPPNEPQHVPEKRISYVAGNRDGQQRLKRSQSESWNSSRPSSRMTLAGLKNRRVQKLDKLAVANVVWGMSASMDEGALTASGHAGGVSVDMSGPMSVSHDDEAEQTPTKKLTRRKTVTFSEAPVVVENADRYKRVQSWSKWSNELGGTLHALAAKPPPDNAGQPKPMLQSLASHDGSNYTNTQTNRANFKPTLTPVPASVIIWEGLEKPAPSMDDIAAAFGKGSPLSVETEARMTKTRSREAMAAAAAGEDKISAAALIDLATTTKIASPSASSRPRSKSCEKFPALTTTQELRDGGDDDGGEPV